LPEARETDLSALSRQRLGPHTPAVGWSGIPSEVQTVSAPEQSGAMVSQIDAQQLLAPPVQPPV
jgi:hypothetical protein